MPLLKSKHPFFNSPHSPDIDAVEVHPIELVEQRRRMRPVDHHKLVLGGPPHGDGNVHVWPMIPSLLKRPRSLGLGVEFEHLR